LLKKHSDIIRSSSNHLTKRAASFVGFQKSGPDR
jgi:hypothetical protein